MCRKGLSENCILSHQACSQDYLDVLQTFQSFPASKSIDLDLCSDKDSP